MSKKIYGIPVSTPINPAKVKPDVPEEQIASNVAAYMERNPVTPSGIGLGNVDNTADKDKPVSTAQAVAIADAKKAGTDAQTAANNAQTSANNAKAAADNAQTAADNAQQTANNAVDAAGNAQTAADNAQQAADDAQTSANNAQTAADNAQQTANDAVTAASNAQTSADNAHAFAQTAIGNHLEDKNNPHKVTCEQIGATSMELLWENASPGSDFAAQTIALDLSGYDHVIIEAVANVAGWAIVQSFTCRVGVDSCLLIPSNAVLNNRSFTTSTTGIRFDGGSSGANALNNCCVPIRIYGIKMAGSPGSGGTEAQLPAAEGVSF